MTVYSGQTPSWLKMIAYEPTQISPISYQHNAADTNSERCTCPTYCYTCCIQHRSSYHHIFDASIRGSSTAYRSDTYTAMFALRAQQRITNWDNRSAYVFDNASRYLSLVQLHTTTTRPFQLHDQLLFLQAGEHPFTPYDPWGTLIFQRHYQYRIVQISNDVLHCDFVELFYAPANTELLASYIILKMRCTYTGTYIVRASNSDTTTSTAPNPSTSVPHLPHQLSAPSSTSTATPNPSHNNPAVGRGSLSHVFRPLPYRVFPSF